MSTRFRPWHGSRNFALVAFAVGALLVLHSLFNWNFLEIQRPSSLPRSVQRVLLGCTGIIFLLFGVVFFAANF